ncbi:MAG: pilus assembly protein PilM [Lachnospiraceae bacterium]|nr:pilus assembly protein PilM [Lachnospiraceae bacterium]
MTDNTAKDYVFGLDIGTRNVVGTVGYRDGKEFYVAAQYSQEHETRAMLDGQIHDIGRVARVIREVKEHLEEYLDMELKEVCIAAAGRVLKTVTTTVDHEFPEETVVTGEHVHTLDLLGVDHAQQILKEKNDTKYKFYCVGYSVIKYYINDEVFSNIEGHKAERIAEDIVVTFLPEDVVDGLYAAVAQAGMEVANLTLEPIAAINVAIPEAYRMLNIALVDVGAGTSDISVTRDGSIIAYGMIPYAGDELTELIVQKYLVDFNTAEEMKQMSGVDEEVEFKDIMFISHTIKSKEIWELTEPAVDRMTTEVANKIKELNGSKTVSATFVVGGGGKIHGFTEMLAEKLDLPKERVALRGEQVLQSVRFAQEEIVKDPLIVTPVGICLNYYDQKNNFVMVHFNGERIKLYDNSHLTIVDTAMQAGFPNEDLFPKRGKSIEFTVNGKQRLVRGEAGESAVVRVDGKVVSINSPLQPNSDIVIEPSTAGKDAEYTIEQLEEYTSSTISFMVNGKTIICPKFVEVNGVLQPGSYRICDQDRIELRNYYTVRQLAEFMDVQIDDEKEIILNGKPADPESLVYENFELEWEVSEVSYAYTYESAEEVLSESKTDGDMQEVALPEQEPIEVQQIEAVTEEQEPEPLREVPEDQEPEQSKEMQEIAEPEELSENREIQDIHITVNGDVLELSGKEEYIFVDIFNFFDFDLSQSNGRAVVTTINGEDAQYTKVLKDGDEIEIYWKENE